MKLPTIHELNKLNEKDFERVTDEIEYEADGGNFEARHLMGQIDLVIAQAGGTFDLDFIPDCEYTQAHTRSFCGNAKCRDS